ncbi:response regulator transcription factor [Humisphaera borealis]|uniref:Response regulator transcription factor n=1 Tax=Humisphaera borealis TaxID=2807512 RepID=A0A7M2WZS2_9BACT|nr:response regulator [Humisphaera borealis]QOV90874.1 response regulator transcription factor [Humisphaera borealis]
MTHELVSHGDGTQTFETEIVSTTVAGFVYVIDDDPAIRRLVSTVLTSQGMRVECFESGKAFLSAHSSDLRGCLLLDVDLPEMSGIDIQGELKNRGVHLPVIFLTGVADVDTSVAVMKRGAFDLIQKPFDKARLIAVVQEAISLDAKRAVVRRREMIARGRYDTLNSREREVMAMVVSGMANKQIARQLELSEKTIEVHRSRAMTKMGADSLAELVRLSLDMGMAPVDAQLSKSDA